jgi:hypothetical protein
MFNPDFNELLSIFNEKKIKYLVVGGYAVGLHAQPRATKDLDLFIRPDPVNGTAVYEALRRFGASLQAVTPNDFIQQGAFFRIGRAPVMVEIFPEIEGLDFDSAWERRVQTVIDPDTGLTAFFVSRDDLIVAKLATGRLQDLAYVDALRKAAKSKKPSRPRSRAGESGPSRE